MTCAMCVNETRLAALEDMATRQCVCPNRGKECSWI
jgi:hypothetical protein